MSFRLGVVVCGRNIKRGQKRARDCSECAGTPFPSQPRRRAVIRPERFGASASSQMRHRIFRCRSAAPVCPVPVPTSTTMIGVGRRVGLRNLQDCDDRILELRNGDNKAAGAARTFKFCLSMCANLKHKAASFGIETFPRGTAPARHLHADSYASLQRSRPP
jgi:hypothetical protein